MLYFSCALSSFTEKKPRGRSAPRRSACCSTPPTWVLLASTASTRGACGSGCASSTASTSFCLTPRKAPSISWVHSNLVR